MFLVVSFVSIVYFTFTITDLEINYSLPTCIPSAIKSTITNIVVTVLDVALIVFFSFETTKNYILKLLMEFSEFVMQIPLTFFTPRICNENLLF